MDQHSVDAEVIHNTAASRFELTIDGLTSVLDYYKTGSTIVFPHTEVPPSQRGRGIAARLAQAALDYAREQQLTIVPSCSYVAGYVRRHPEYQPLVAAR